MTDESVPQRDEQAIRRFVERFAAGLVEAGMPAMPARVFSALLATDSGRLTAAELATQLDASPAAISGAVRYLALVGMIGRERVPGPRRAVGWPTRTTSCCSSSRRWARSCTVGAPTKPPTAASSMINSTYHWLRA